MNQIDPPEPPRGTPPAEPTRPSLPSVLRKASDLFDRAAPTLRKVGDVVGEHAGTAEARDALAAKAVDIVGKADDALRRATAVEGSVVEGSATSSPAHPTHEPPPPAARGGHWTKARLRRMVFAAAREATRPSSPRAWAGSRGARVAAAVSMLGVVVLIRRRRHG